MTKRKQGETYTRPLLQSKKIKLDLSSVELKEGQHPKGWTQTNHYGMCGQSCPCCRAKIEETPIGVCPICWDPDKMII